MDNNFIWDNKMGDNFISTWSDLSKWIYDFKELPRVLVHHGNLWVKCSFTSDDPTILTGWEVFDTKPSKEYWQDAYGHAEPMIIKSTRSFALQKKSGKQYLVFHLSATAGAMVEETDSLKTW